MGVETPNYLIALLAAPLLIGTVTTMRRRRSRYGVLFTNFAILATLGRPDTSRGWNRHAPLGCVALAVTFCALSLARPYLAFSSSNRTTTVVLAVDVSGSMQAHDIGPTRLTAAVRAMQDFLATLPVSDKVGLVTFSDSVNVIAQPTANHTVIDSALSILDAEGGTALGEGIEEAVEQVRSSLDRGHVQRDPGAYAAAAIVLESDGAQDRGLVSPLASAEYAKAAGIRIYGVSVGTRHGYVQKGSGVFVENFNVPPDPGTVALLARESGGEAFTASTATQLDDVYRKLGAGIGRARGQTDIGPWLQALSSVVLLVGIGSGASRRSL